MVSLYYILPTKALKCMTNVKMTNAWLEHWFICGIRYGPYSSMAHRRRTIYNLHIMSQ